MTRFGGEPGDERIEPHDASRPDTKVTGFVVPGTKEGLAAPSPAGPVNSREPGQVDGDV
jgi:hypothetical protein